MINVRNEFLCLFEGFFLWYYFFKVDKALSCEDIETILIKEFFDLFLLCTLTLGKLSSTRDQL